jgi:hypothetical protein
MSARLLAPLVLPLAIVALVMTPRIGFAQAEAVGQPAGPSWWAGAGGGYLAGRASCTNCESDRSFGDGYALLAQGGVRVKPRLLVGAEIFSTARAPSGISVRDSYLLAVAQYRPFARLGFFIKGGYGMAAVKDTVATADGPVTARTWGMGLMYGAGWVFGERRRISVAPMGGTYVTTVGDISAPAGTAENVVVNSWFAGVVVMFR